MKAFYSKYWKDYYYLSGNKTTKPEFLFLQQKKQNRKIKNKNKKLKLFKIENKR